MLRDVSHVQPITGERADEIAQECPGLFEVKGKGKSREAKVNSAREHPKLIEKVLVIVCSCILEWMVASLQSVLFCHIRLDVLLHARISLAFAAVVLSLFGHYSLE